jgi:hypothetical protein
LALLRRRATCVDGPWLQPRRPGARHEHRRQRGATTPATSTGGPGAPQAEANATAAGDIPDNQVFLVFRNGAGGYTMKYPEGSAQQGSGKRVTFRDKNNIVRVVVGSGAAPTIASIQADVGGLTGASAQSSTSETSKSC